MCVDTYIYSSPIAVGIQALTGHYTGFWQATFVLYMIRLSYNFWFLDVPEVILLPGESVYMWI
jgi:hypothetical protein